MLRWLLDNGADVDAKDRDGRTPVYDAVRHANDDAIKMLVDAGAKLDMDGLGMMLCDAGATNNVRLLARLLENGVSPNVADYDARTALHLAASNGNIEAIEYLLAQPSVDVNAEDRYGMTALSVRRRRRRRRAAAPACARGRPHLVTAPAARSRLRLLLPVNGSGRP